MRLGKNSPTQSFTTWAVEEGESLLANDDFTVVGLNEKQFLGRGGEGKYDLLDGRRVIFNATVKAVGHVPGGGHALKGFDQGPSACPVQCRGWGRAG